MANRYKTTPSAAAEPPAQQIYAAVRILCERRARSIEHVIERINSQLGPLSLHEWTLESATAHGLVLLLDILGQQEWEGVPQSFREQ